MSGPSASATTASGSIRSTPIASLESSNGSTAGNCPVPAWASRSASASSNGITAESGLSRGTAQVRDSASRFLCSITARPEFGSGVMSASTRVAVVGLMTVFVSHTRLHLCRRAPGALVARIPAQRVHTSESLLQSYITCAQKSHGSLKPATREGERIARPADRPIRGTAAANVDS